MRVCDELKMAKELYDYFKKVLTDHIENTLVPKLKKKKED